MHYRRKHKRGRFTRHRSCPYCYPQTWMSSKVNTTHNNLVRIIASKEAVQEYKEQ